MLAKVRAWVRLGTAGGVKAWMRSPGGIAGAGTGTGGGVDVGVVSRGRLHREVKAVVFARGRALFDGSGSWRDIHEVLIGTRS